MPQRSLFSKLVSSLSSGSLFFESLMYAPWILLAYLGISVYTEKLAASDLAVIRDFIGWIGIVYSIFISSVLVNAWAQFEALGDMFDREIDAITNLYQALTRLETRNNKSHAKLNKIRLTLIKDVANYIRHVIETHQTEFRYLPQYHAGQKMLDDIGGQISLLISNQNHKTTEMQIAELLRCSNDIASARSFRISYSKRRVSVFVESLAWIISIAWLVPFWALDIIDPLLAMVILGGITFVAIMTLVAIRDLNDPFGGAIKIDLEPWYEFLERIEDNPKFLFVYNIASSRINELIARFGLVRCKLSRFRFSGFWGNSWKKFLRQIEETRPKSVGTITWDSVYADQYPVYGYDRHLGNPELPLVIMKLSDRFLPFITAQEIRDCRNLAEFEFLFRKKLQEHFS